MARQDCRQKPTRTHHLDDENTTTPIYWGQDRRTTNRHVNRPYSRPPRRAAQLLPALCLCLGLLHVPPSEAAELEGALAAVERGDYASAIPRLDALAAAGDPVALTQLAALYQAGKGVGKDPARAASLYEQAAQRGNADAQFNLGNMYLLGEGVAQDDDWAFTYYRAAARQGHVLAQKNVREFYRAAGLTPPPDEVAPPAAEVKPATAAAPENDASAPAPEPAAVASTPPSASPAGPPAAYSADELKAMQIARQHGIRIEQAPLPPAEGAALAPDGPAREWQAPSAAGEPAAGATRAPEDADLAQARSLLASGKSADARRLLEAQAMAGNAEAQFLLSQLLVTLKRGPEDQADALCWLQRSAAGGRADAQFALAARYERGDGVAVDDAEAVTWYRAAARQGHEQARERLRAIYREAGIPLPAEVAPPSADPDGAALPIGRTDVSLLDDSLNQRLCIQHAYSLQVV